MPITITRTIQSGETYASPFIGPVDHTFEIEVDLTALTTAEIDAYGYLRPGVPFTRDGTLVGAGPAFVFGVVPEAIKVAENNEAATIAALSTTARVAVATIGQVNRAMVESHLGRALTADEIAGFDRAGSKLVLCY